ncbi:hypothetical protein R3P38DRAFT_3241892 [Favolaschia claudopus]|uniref:Uncharacterized protein n=1 Tax=Favolaschia claudopus TaxID=2862362 RepID=A0AAV9Z5Y7_9AGAR
MNAGRCGYWLAEEWEVVASAMAEADDNDTSFSCGRTELCKLCASWSTAIRGIPFKLEGLPPWGPSDDELRAVRLDDKNAKTVARDVDDDDDEEVEADGEEEELPIEDIEAFQRAEGAKDDKQRYDIGCVTNKFGERLVIYLTEHDLNVMNGPHLQNVKCECCHLVVPDWAFGEYFLKRDSEGTYLVVIHKICLGCWRYTILNPRFDYVESEDTPPPVSSSAPAHLAAWLVMGQERDVLYTTSSLSAPCLPVSKPTNARYYTKKSRGDDRAKSRLSVKPRRPRRTDEEYAALSKRLEEVFESGDKARAYAAKVKGMSPTPPHILTITHERRSGM